MLIALRLKKMIYCVKVPPVFALLLSTLANTTDQHGKAVVKFKFPEVMGMITGFNLLSFLK